MHRLSACLHILHPLPLRIYSFCFLVLNDARLDHAIDYPHSPGFIKTVGSWPVIPTPTLCRRPMSSSRLRATTSRLKALEASWYSRMVCRPAGRLQRGGGGRGMEKRCYRVSSRADTASPSCAAYTDCRSSIKSGTYTSITGACTTLSTKCDLPSVPAPCSSWFQLPRYTTLPYTPTRSPKCRLSWYLRVAAVTHGGCLPTIKGVDVVTIDRNGLLTNHTLTGGRGQGRGESSVMSCKEKHACQALVNHVCSCPMRLMQPNKSAHLCPVCGGFEPCFAGLLHGQCMALAALHVAPQQAHLAPKCLNTYSGRVRRRALRWMRKPLGCAHSIEKDKGKLHMESKI